MSKSNSLVPNARVTNAEGKPAFSVASSNSSLPRLRNSGLYWREKAVRKMSGKPSPSKSAISAPMPASVLPFMSKPTPAPYVMSSNVPSPLLRYRKLRTPSLATKMSGQPSPSMSPIATPSPLPAGFATPALRTPR